MNKLIVLALAVSFATPAHSETYTIDGYGNINCSKWTTLRAAASADKAEQWALGYLDGLSVGFKFDLTKDWPIKIMWNLIDVECIEHSQATLGAATRDVAVALRSMQEMSKK